LRLGRQRQAWLIPNADERVGVQVKPWNPLRTCAIPERFCGGVSLRRGAISSVTAELLNVFWSFFNIFQMQLRGLVIKRRYAPLPLRTCRRTDTVPVFRLIITKARKAMGSNRESVRLRWTSLALVLITSALFAF